MYEDIASARFFRSKSAGINSFEEVVRADDFVIADIDGDLYQLLLDGEQDVLATEAAALRVRDALAAGNAFGAGELHELRSPVIDPAARPRVSRSEQSNTSIFMGDAMCKFFRKLEPGINPEIELLEGLTRVGCTYVPALRGHATIEVAGEEYVTALIQDLVPDAQDGWALAVASARTGSNFSTEAQLIGKAVSQVHQDLGTAFGTATISQALLMSQLSQRVDTLVAQAPVLADYADQARSCYARAAVGDTEVQRVHGDLHLGQILRDAHGYKLIDFEGEPARPLAERREPSSPLQDVAGMVRSFAYAAAVGGHDVGATDVFLQSYGVAMDNPLLQAFVLDKAMYEVAYEANNRPDWVDIPLQSVRELTAH